MAYDDDDDAPKEIWNQKKHIGWQCSKFGLSKKTQKKKVKIRNSRKKKPLAGSVANLATKENQKRKNKFGKRKRKRTMAWNVTNLATKENQKRKINSGNK